MKVIAAITDTSAQLLQKHYDIPTNSWVAVKELKLRDYPPIMEKKMENEMETGGM